MIIKEYVGPGSIEIKYDESKVKPREDKLETYKKNVGKKKNSQGKTKTAVQDR